MADMMSKERLRKEAAAIKVNLINRAARMMQDSEVIAKAQAGLINIKKERLETMISIHKTSMERQWDDSLVYATMRWILGITDEIDVENLGLDE